MGLKTSDSFLGHFFSLLVSRPEQKRTIITPTEVERMGKEKNYFPLIVKLAFSIIHLSFPLPE